MPTGPKGEKRPADVIANAVLSMKIATGEAEERYVNAGQSAGGRKGGKRGASGAGRPRNSPMTPLAFMPRSPIRPPSPRPSTSACAGGHPATPAAALVGGSAGRRAVPVEDADVVEQRLVVGLERHDVVAAAGDDLPGGVRAAVQGVRGDRAARDADLGEQPADAKDLAAGAVGADLTAHHAAAVLDRGDEHAVRVRAAGPVEGRRLAVDGDGAASGRCVIRLANSAIAVGPCAAADDAGSATPRSASGAPGTSGRANTRFGRPCATHRPCDFA